MAKGKRLPAGPVRTAKVKLLKGVVLSAGLDGVPGEIYEVPKHFASQLVANGQAEYTDEGDPSQGDDPGAESHKAGYETTTIEKPTARDPKPQKRG